MIDRPNREFLGLAKKYPRIFKVVTAIVCLTICFLVIVGYATPRTVTVNLDDSKEIISKTYETTERNVASFIESHSIDFDSKEDAMNVKLDDRVYDGLEIKITKAIDISIKADGKELKYSQVPPVKVETALKEAGITLGEDDTMNFSLQDEIQVKDEEIIIKRVTFGEDIVIKTVDYKEVVKADSSMQVGKVKTVTKGKDGKIEKKYQVRYEDGEEVSRELVDTTVKEEAVKKVVKYGTKITSSRPKKYTRKISGVKAYSYYMRGNPHGAYGKKCTYGTCAVDPKLIPLGSLLYIEGYGYAIANDVGTGIKGKKVDLYMEKGIQCSIWGARNVDVYVVRYGPK